MMVAIESFGTGCCVWNGLRTITICNDVICKCFSFFLFVKLYIRWEPIIFDIIKVTILTDEEVNAKTALKIVNFIHLMKAGRLV